MKNIRQKVAEDGARLRASGTNLTLITVLLAIVSVTIVFFGPFVSVKLLEMKTSISIFHTVWRYIALGTSCWWLGYALLGVLLGIPVLIIICSLFQTKVARRIAFWLSLIETVVLIGITWRLLTGTGPALEMAQNIFTNQHPKQLLGITMGFGISSYLLLLTSVLTSVTTFFDQK